MELIKRRRELLTRSPKIVYSARNLVFDGTNYIDTGVYLYSAENIDKDFEIILKLGEINDAQVSQASILASMDEHNPYPGFVIRNEMTYKNIQISGEGNFVYNDTILSYENILNKNIHLKKEGLLYTSWIDGHNRIWRTDVRIKNTVFDVPVTLGAGLDRNQTPFRFWKGTISHIRIEYI